ncbi:MAG: hypothetical protein WCA36_12895, partial [Pseudolabrys sp.]
MIDPANQHQIAGSCSLGKGRGAVVEARSAAVCYRSGRFQIHADAIRGTIRAPMAQFDPKVTYKKLECSKSFHTKRINPP